MKGALDASAIVSTKVADAGDHPVQVFVRHLAIKERHITRGESRLWAATAIHHDLQEAIAPGGELFSGCQLADGSNDLAGETGEKQVEIVDNRLVLNRRASWFFVGVASNAHGRILACACAVGAACAPPAQLRAAVASATSQRCTPVSPVISGWKAMPRIRPWRAATIRPSSRVATARADGPTFTISGARMKTA